MYEQIFTFLWPIEKQGSHGHKVSAVAISSKRKVLVQKINLLFIVSFAITWEYLESSGLEVISKPKLAGPIKISIHRACSWVMHITRLDRSLRNSSSSISSNCFQESLISLFMVKPQRTHSILFIWVSVAVQWWQETPPTPSNSPAI